MTKLVEATKQYNSLTNHHALFGYHHSQHHVLHYFCGSFNYIVHKLDNWDDGLKPPGYGDLATNPIAASMI